MTAPTQSAPAAQVQSALTASVPPASAPPTSAPTATVVSSTIAATPAPAPTSTSITPTPFSPAVPAAPAQGAKPKTGDTERVADALLDGIMGATASDQGTAPQVGLAGLRERVTEDTAILSEANKRRLHDAFKPIEFTNNGEQSWQRLQKGSHDILITDQEKPRLNGFELTTRLRGDTRRKNLPVISVSARDTEDFDERARGPGSTATKPNSDRCTLIYDE